MGLEGKLKNDAPVERCEEYDAGKCKTYGKKCFHSAKKRCYIFMPRTESELKPWMDASCYTCQEPECSCHLYDDYMEQLRAHER